MYNGSVVADSSRPVSSPANLTPTFATLGVAHDLVRVLERSGISEPFPIQAMTLPDAIAGRDVCGKAQTGSGKTLAFGLAVVQRTRRAQPRRPQSLILVPTRELANQVATVLAPYAGARNLRLSAIYGGVSMVRQIQALRAGLDLVVATPGRLNDLLDRGEVSVAEVEQVVLDEADQMADMGFLPQVERILRRIKGRPQTLLFSATLDDAVQGLVKRYQHDPVRHDVISATATVESLEQRFVAVAAADKVRLAASLVRDTARALIFVRTQRGAERLAKQLALEGVNVGRIHGRLSQSQRERVLAAFTAGTVPVLVATNVAARGLHVDDISIVVHYDLPDDYKTYIHRSGRTARAGASGQVVTLVEPQAAGDASRLQRAAGIRRAVAEMAPSRS